MLLKNWQKLQRLCTYSLIFIVISVTPSLACARVQTINVFVAASLVDIMENIGEEYGVRINCVSIRIVSGSSSILSRQIISGAPAGIFISADRINADLVAEEFSLTPASLFGNRLAIIGPDDFVGQIDIEELGQLLKSGERMAIGDPDNVPAGIYARQALQKAGVWPGLKDRLAPAGDVRAAVAFVANGAAPFGIVYVSDASFEGVRIIGQIDESLHEPIKYWGVLLDASSSKGAGFLEFLESEYARKALESAGFNPLESN